MTGKSAGHVPRDNAGGGIPDGKTITEYLSQEGYSRGVDISGREPYAQPTFLRVQGGRKYEIGPLIAQGGMGAIYEARELNSRRVVALKVLPKEIPYSRQDLLRFIREGQLTSQLEHPNIVPVHEMGLDEAGTVYYTMKLVEGRTLTSILQAIRKGEAQTRRAWCTAT
jgi:serine/threonine protein kinase